MKKHIYYILILLTPFFTNAQQTAQYSQYYVNNFGYNPAFAGATGCIDFTFGGKYQWMGFEGAPRDLFVSAHGSKGQKYHTNKGRWGFGGYIEQDRVHVTTRNIFKAAVAYHKRIFARTSAAAGLFLGLEQYAVDDVFGNTNADPVLASAAGANLLYPEVMPGILLYNNRWYMGLSVNQLTPHDTKLGGGEHKLRNHYYFTYLHNSFVNDWIIKKSVFVKFARLAPFVADANISWEYRGNFTFGLGYRWGEAAMANIMFKLFGNMKIGYAFDFPLNKIKNTYSYSHEIMIRFSKCPDDMGGSPRGKVNKVACPAF
jgi:type IX secretion system PorP/SprF family membrane protein